MEDAIKYCISDIYHCLYFYILMHPTFTEVISRAAHHIRQRFVWREWLSFFCRANVSKVVCRTSFYIFIVGICSDNSTSLSKRPSFFFRKHQLFRLVYYYNQCTYIVLLTLLLLLVLQLYTMRFDYYTAITCVIIVFLRHTCRVRINLSFSL